MHVVIRALAAQDVSRCVAINRSLPAWFGLDDGLAEAEEYLRDHHGLVALRGNEIVGYLTWHEHFAGSAEVSWMAVDPGYHRSGVGRRLIAALEALLPTASLLSVKTLADTHPSPEYAATRAFYRTAGFRPQMVFPDLWDPANPCLLMVKVVEHPA